MKLNHILLSVATIFISLIGFSQKNSDHHMDNLVFMLRQTEHISQALKTVGQLQEGQSTSLKTGKVVIIVCGEAVNSLVKKDAEEWVEKTKKYPNVSILACGLSLAKFNKSKEDLIKGIGYTENGFIKAFELQKQGYLSVEL